MKDLMIDLETLGTGSDAVVLSIGACFFDVYNKALGEGFYVTLDIEPQLSSKRQVTASTLKWWMSQTNEARQVFNEKPLHPIQGLHSFTNWINHNADDELNVWGNGSSFDIVILESLLKDFNYQVPWTFSGVMDLRTFRRFVGKNAKVERIGTHHNALDDAISQAKYVIEHTRNK